jgi:pimeloyl-ACP methyl ester carboxylesterase
MRLILEAAPLCATAFVAALCGISSVPLAQAAREPLDMHPYTFTTFDGQEHQSQAGTLTVQENRRSASGHTIEVGFVRLPHSGQAAGPPLVFLPPGPGTPSTTLGRVPVYFRLFDRLRANGDVILLDVRGEGMSTPNLDECPPAPAVSPHLFEDFGSLVHQFAASVDHCAQFWRSKGVDLAAYNNGEIADDVDALRQALGYQRIRLLGFSAGTNLALAILRHHGDEVDRVVLAATSAAEFNPPHLPSTLDGQLRKVAALYASAAGSEVSDLVTLMADDLGALAKRPAQLPMAKGPDQLSTPVLVGPIGLQLIVSQMIGSDRSAMLPALLGSVHDGDYSLLRILAQKQYAGFHSSMTLVGRTIDCSEAMRSDRLARVEIEARGSLFADIANVYLRPEVCRAALGHTLAPVAVVRAMFSPIPTLFITGSMDSNTPPFDAEALRWTLPNSVHVIVSNGFHETLPAQEVQDLVVDFFAGREVTGRSITFAPPKFLSREEAEVVARQSR